MEYGMKLLAIVFLLASGFIGATTVFVDETPLILNIAGYVAAFIGAYLVGLK